MTICPHGVELGLVHEPRLMLGDVDGAAVGVPMDVSDLPTGKCPCCKGEYVYDTPLDQRRRSKHCPNCQAVTADPDKDHLADAPLLRGGPHKGRRLPVLPGVEPDDRVTAGDEDDRATGHYVRAADGNYDWVKEPLSPISEAPPAPGRKKK